MIFLSPNRILLCAIAFGALFFTAQTVQAAKLIVEAPKREYAVGDEFPISIYLDSEGEAVNAVAVHIALSPHQFDIHAVEGHRSFVTLWTYQPSWNKATGEALFVGGLPDPGFSGARGLVGTIVVKATAKAMAHIGFTQANQVLKNDGNGTAAKLAFEPLGITVKDALPGRVPEGVAPIPDITPPRNVQIAIGSDESLFDGKFFAAFSAEDPESGIAGYYIAEKPLKSARAYGSVYPTETEWVAAKSPHVLRSQKGMAAVFVKAVDNAGNQTVESVLFNQSRPRSHWPFLLLVAGIAALCILFIARLRQKRVALQKALQK